MVGAGDSMLTAGAVGEVGSVGASSRPKLMSEASCSSAPLASATLAVGLAEVVDETPPFPLPFCSAMAGVEAFDFDEDI